MYDFLSKQRLLVIAPHSDDETFGCAGTIARIKAAGGEVFVIVVSIGDLTHYNERSDRFVSAETRLNEFQSAMAFLKVDGCEVIYKDEARHLRLDAVPQRDLIGALERDCNLAIDKIKPTAVALPAASYNQDHRAVFDAGFTACRPHLPSVKPFQTLVLSYDNPAISWSLERQKFHPNFYVDISNYLPLKLKAVSLHSSQMKPSVHHASLENVEWLARVRGREISVDAAEAFMCHRFVINEETK